MKTRLLCIIMIIFSLCAYSQKEKPNIEGAWKQVYHQTITGNSVVVDFPGKSEVNAIKIWSGDHFMFVVREKVDTTVTDGYGVGTYTLTGNRYEEHIKILSYKPWEGTTIKMLLEIKNDTLIQSYPVDEKGKMNEEWAIIEKYVRIKN
jgi:CTP-dependent riboflavin kinase